MQKHANHTMIDNLALLPSAPTTQAKSGMGPFEHQDFKPEPSWLPYNYLVMIDWMISANELDLAKSKVNAQLRQNLSREEL